MQLDFAFICDYAETPGKINALGIGFDTIYAPKMPCRHPYFFLVFQARANILETGEKKLELDLIDEDGAATIKPISINLTLPKPTAGSEAVSKLAVQFQNVEFPHYGIYSVHALLDGNELVSIPLRISPTPTGAAH